MDRVVLGRRIWLSLFLLGVIAFADSSWSDTLVFRNGDSITGTFVNFDGKSVTFETDYAGKLTVAAEHVRWVETEDEIMVIPADGDAKTESPREPLKLVDVRYAGPPLPTTPQPEIDWSGSIDALLTIRSGERDTLDAQTTLTTLREKQRRLLDTLTPVSELELVLSGAYGEVDDEVDTQRALATETYRYFFRPKIYFLQLAGFEHDDPRTLELRATFGLGAGYQIFDTDIQSLATDAALVYDYERWDETLGGTRTENNISLRLGLRYARQFESGAEFTEALTLQPSIDDLGEYRATNVAAFNAPLSESLQFRAQWSLEYDSDPGDDDVENLENILTTGIRYEF